MKVGEIDYEDAHPDDSVFTGDVLETVVEYTPWSADGKAQSRKQPIKAMVYRGKFREAGKQVEAKDSEGKTMYHMKNGTPVKPVLTRLKDTVVQSCYYLCPVGQTGIQQIVRLPDDWKEIHRREREGVQAQTGEGMQAAMEAMSARISENERRHQEEQQRVLHHLQALGIKPEDVGMKGKGK